MLKFNFSRLWHKNCQSDKLNKMGKTKYHSFNEIKHQKYSVVPEPNVHIEKRFVITFSKWQRLLPDRSSCSLQLAGFTITIFCKTIYDQLSAICSQQ